MARILNSAIQDRLARFWHGIVASPRTAQWAKLARRVINVVMLLYVYFIVASAAFNGYVTKWATGADETKYLTVKSELEGTAYKPFAYRHLLADMTNAIDKIVPAKLKPKIISQLDKDHAVSKIVNTTASRDPSTAFRAYILYYLTFAFAWASLFVMRMACQRLDFDTATATIAPALLLLLFPVFLSQGGYDYDFAELFFMAAAIWLALAGRWWALLALTLFAAWNKETFAPFAIALYPLLRIRLGRLAAASTIGGCLVIAAGVLGVLHWRFGGNPGTLAIFWLPDNIRFYGKLYHLLGVEGTYGITGPRAYSFIVIGLIAVVVKRGWPRMSQPVRRHIIIAACINFPLFVLFCWRAEMRNLSMLSMSFLVLLAASVEAWLIAWRPAPRVGSVGEAGRERLATRST